MNKKLLPLILLASTTLLTACNEKKDSPLSSVSVSKEDAIALVNGKYISKTSLEALEKEISQRNRGQSLPKEKLVEELIQRELLVQEAIQKKLHTTTEYTEQLETVKASLLTQATVQNFLKSNPISDADVKAEYDKNIVDTGEEYKARHILVKTEEDAKQIIAELTGGADFAELAKSKSTGPSGPNGGDLGWFAPGQMVAPFSEAVIALADNKFTLEPVKTQFGYHVILREASRAQKQTPPSFESIKEQIRPAMQRKKLQEFLAELREKAKVEIFLPAPVAPAPKAVASDATQSTADKTSTEISKSAEQAKETVSGTATNAVDNAQSATDSIVTETSKSVDQAKSAVADTAKDAANKISETVGKTGTAVSEKATKTIDALTK
jgi:peptidyl-prolyl cis-trans isomerase C